MLKVLCFCHECRIDPAAGLAYKGSQNTNLDAYIELRKLEGLVLKAWKKKEKEWAEE